LKPDPSKELAQNLLDKESFKYQEPSVFCDTSNPLLQQLGIFAQCLEVYEDDQKFLSNKEKF
jgi:hypothetical protein